MRRTSGLLMGAMLAIALPGPPAPAQTPATPSATPAMPATHTDLVRLFADWRAFVRPAIRNGVPDYSAAAMAVKAADLPRYRDRLNAIDRAGWPEAALGDYRLVEAEMNGFDFFLRVLRPWARDPGFYQTIFGEESDVPAHEGPSASPTIDLFAYRWPLSRADDRQLTGLIGAVPAMLAQARGNLAGSNAADLWRYGDRAFREQAEVLDALEMGTLSMRTIDGKVPASLAGASPGLRRAVTAAKDATEAFAAWIAAEAPRKTGPSGIGKANYDWYAAHVQLSPYGWDQQAILLQRELDRAIASLRLEELRNRKLPPITPIDDPATYRAMAEAKTKRFNDFMVDTGLMPDKPYFRAAMAAQTSSYIPPEQQDFFGHGTALDPLPLLSHSSHWIELARLKHEPRPSPIRQVPPLFNIFADRSEGFATAMEEMLMQAGLYDDIPHGREIVWIMLANRAARGLASLHVQANEIDLAQAGHFHAEWTPRHWSNASSKLVGFEQLLYLRQPGYGPSYIVGKMQLDHLFALESHAAEQAGRPFVMGEAFARIMQSGIVPPALIGDEMFGAGAGR
ncbi:Uncharacterized conserved protein, DUF885 familyt [Sphingomonas sp. YR710]|uniref:DUF885 domain-containing protein n=1 Tax=Sphingomonas sp. YR710 TaxID=1882773 RepID=UPI0008817214|nr:DUF885 domain-containing protein [Sphingomonas sp. YR710]SDD52724.1 Uncharacterized conserved protein, DUF885 familyt [Sphingomonas sp. YR710]